MMMIPLTLGEAERADLAAEHAGVAALVAARVDEAPLLAGVEGEATGRAHPLPRRPHSPPVHPHRRVARIRVGCNTHTGTGRHVSAAEPGGCFWLSEGAQSTTRTGSPHHLRAFR